MLHYDNEKDSARDDEERGFSLPYTPNYVFVETEEHARQVLPELMKHKVLAVDTETTGLDPYLCRLLLLQIATPKCCYILNCGKVDARIWKPVLESPDILKIAQYASFDYKVLKVHADASMRPIFDTMIAERLLTVGKQRKTSLQYMAAKYLGLDLDKEIRRDFIGIYRDKFSKAELLYAANDALILFEIYDRQIDALQRDELITVALLEFNTVVPVAEMELNGCLLDQGKWRQLLQVARKNREEVEEKIKEALAPVCNQLSIFGECTINISSQKQLLIHLHRLGIDIEDTSDETLKKVKNPVTDLIRKWRGWEKICTAYGEKFLSKINPKTGRLHAQFNQVRADTGRMSSSKPNLQQVLGFIPDDPDSLNFRSCFIAPPGYRMVTADFSQQELRIIACLSGDESFIKAYVNGEDIHSQTAINIWGGTDAEVRSNGKRKIAKCVSGDTLINVSGRGLVPIKSISTNRSDDTFSALEGVKVNSNDGRGGFYTKADQFYYNGIGPAYRIETELGYPITVGENHKFRCVDGKGLFTWKTASELAINDVVCLQSYDSDVWYDVSTDMQPLEKVKSYEDLSFPEYFDEYVCRWLGYFVSEGSVYGYNDSDTTYTTSITVLNSEDNREMVEDLRLVHQMVFGSRFREIKWNRGNRENIAFKVSSKQLIRWLEKLEVGDNSATKAIPDVIFTLPLWQRAEFVRALYEGDGWNCGRFNIGYCSKSEVLIDKLQQLLLSFDIWSSKKIHTKKKYGDFYYLTVFGSDSREKFLTSIGFVSSRKQGVFEKSKFVVDKNVIPFPVHKLEKFLPLVRSPEKEKIRECTRFNKRVAFNETRARLVLELCEDTSISEYSELNTLVKSGLRFSRISNKERTTTELFDISVPETRSYVSSGYLTHNTVNFLMCYGGSAYTLANRLGIPEEEAEQIIADYFRSYPGLKAYISKAGNFAVQNGYSLTVSGRRRYYDLPTTDDEKYKQKMAAVKRKGANTPVQGSAADVSKQALCNFFYALEEGGYDAQLLMIVHDEIVCQVKEEQADEVAKLLEKSMIKGFTDFFRAVPMEADACVDYYWHH